MDPDILKLLGTGGVAAALLWLIRAVGLRLVAAIDRLGTKVDEHTKVDLEHHAEVKEKVIALDAKLEEVLARRMTPVHGVPIQGGEYSQRLRKP